MLTLLLSVFSLVSPAQETRVVFYNVENLFDTQNDTLTRDEEFLPGGEKHWTEERCFLKRVRIYQTMVALSMGEMPAVIGICEVENRQVVDRLLFDTPLHRLGYRALHRESPDMRGVDVAVLYRQDLFFPDSARWLDIGLPDGETTREVLAVSGKLWGEINVNIYVCHWPSRYGGAVTSAVKRKLAASRVASDVTTMMNDNPGANIIIMGDMNDEPTDPSLTALIRESGDRLINLSPRLAPGTTGTIKHKGEWAVFDQFLVSKGILIGEYGISLTANEMEIYDLGFLLEPDLTYTGLKPYRTYLGPQFHGGFSDHLPVGITLKRTFSGK